MRDALKIRIANQELQALLVKSAEKHLHLCPRQVLGVRIGLAGAAVQRLDVPRKDKRLLVVVETDGCFISGIEAATGLSVNRRTMRIVDYGKIAATFIDVRTHQAFRVAPADGIRERARAYSDETRRYFAMLEGYQRMPDDELLHIEQIELKIDLEALISRPGVRAKCEICGEEIINERERVHEGMVLCKPCAGDSYYS